MKRILIAGIGNIFFGDDGFGVEVVQQLARRPWPEEVQLMDAGIRSYDLAYALSSGFDAAILLDAAPRGAQPGTVYLLELDRGELSRLANEVVNAHRLDPASVLQMAERLGGCPERLYLVGCEPAELEPPDGQAGLSQPVAAAVSIAAEMTAALVANWLGSGIKQNAGLSPA